MPTNSSAKSSTSRGTADLLGRTRPRRTLFCTLSLFLLCAAGAGCLDPMFIIVSPGIPGALDPVPSPVFSPIPTDTIRPIGVRETLVALPNRGSATIRMEVGHGGGRVWITRIAIINHDPDAVTLFTTRTRVYIDDGAPLGIINFRDLDRENRDDAPLLQNLPANAVGKWLLPRCRYVIRHRVRGPTVVLFYSVQGRDGFAKIEYRFASGMPE